MADSKPAKKKGSYFFEQIGKVGCVVFLLAGVASCIPGIFLARHGATNVSSPTTESSPTPAPTATTDAETAISDPATPDYNYVVTSDIWPEWIQVSGRVKPTGSKNTNYQCSGDTTKPPMDVVEGNFDCGFDDNGFAKAGTRWIRAQAATSEDSPDEVDFHFTN